MGKAGSSGDCRIRIDCVGLEATQPGARGSLFEKFECDIGPVDVATYKARAAQLRPPVPWLILALYHRGAPARTRTPVTMVTRAADRK